MHHGIAQRHAVTSFCLLNSAQAKENRIWSSFIRNFTLFPSLGDVPEKWGMTQNPNLGEVPYEPEGSLDLPCSKSLIKDPYCG